jgi:transposase
MLDMLKRHEIQVLRKAGHSQGETAKLAGVGERTVRRVETEPAVATVDDAAERERRQIGRPAKADSFRPWVLETLGQEPQLLTLELLRRARLAGYPGGKSAFYSLVAAVRPSPVRAMTRFEGLPAEFCQHDFGHVDVRWIAGGATRVHFFASRLKYSRWAEVSLVDDERVETLVRTLVDHYAAIGGVPLLAVFDRPKTVALKWRKDGEVTEWNPTFGAAMLELGVGVEVCWPARGNQKGAVENLVGWVKGSFFKQRRFLDHEDLRGQLTEWRRETNTERPSCRPRA